MAELLHSPPTPGFALIHLFMWSVSHRAVFHIQMHFDWCVCEAPQLFLFIFLKNPIKTLFIGVC